MHEFRDIPLVSISDAQRPAGVDAADWVGTVYHGLPPDLLPFSADAERLPRVPRPHLAGEARRPRDRDRAAGRHAELRIAAKVDDVDREYFEPRSSRCSSCRRVVFSARSTRRRRPDLLGGARALLFPIDWPEPFGMVMIEAMACGTPVVAWNHGSVPELIDEGVNGLDRRLDRGGGRGAAARSTGSTARRAARLRAALHRRAHGPRLRARSTRRCARQQPGRCGRPGAHERRSGTTTRRSTTSPRRPTGRAPRRTC